MSSQATSKRAPEETSSGARSAKERFGLRPASVVAEEDILTSLLHRDLQKSAHFARTVPLLATTDA